MSSLSTTKLSIRFAFDVPFLAHSARTSEHKLVDHRTQLGEVGPAIARLSQV